MRWWWQKPKALPIPTYRPPITRTEPEPSAVEVQEIKPDELPFDATDLSATGIVRALKRPK